MNKFEQIVAKQVITEEVFTLACDRAVRQAKRDLGKEVQRKRDMENFEKVLWAEWLEETVMLVRSIVKKVEA